MPQLGSNEKPFVMSTGTKVSKESRFRKGFDKKKYSENYDRIFKKEATTEKLRSTNEGTPYHQEKEKIK